ncbi:acyltransferase family protein [Paenibacillus sp. HW567]|uniref:acyltransferase family protein n=1 Tax=Paenibacillus sp. HW567 TaxID=1034769 RepID=UPI0003801CB2|nr:acyltransferase family protein [Paenibacillus sp. HW567]
MSDSKLLYLNGLRGVAALVVVFSHYTLSFFPALHTGNTSDVYNSFELFVSGSPLNVFYNGSFAVFIFFILSGFVLSYKYWGVENYKFNDFLGNIIKTGQSKVL